MENWKKVVGYEGIYEVSDKGKVRTVGRYITDEKKTIYRKPIIKKQTITKNGYLTVVLNKDGSYKNAYVHRLVATAFFGEPKPGEQVNHKDENKLNNCVENLEWVTQLENLAYGTRSKRMGQTRSLRVEKYSMSGELVTAYGSLSETKRDGYSPSNIKYACDGKFKQMYGYIWRWAT